jgi:HAMP domain-containing protein
MFRTLYGKLVAAFLALLLLLGLVYLGLTLVMTPLYVQEVNQSLNRSLADHIVESKPLIQDRQVNQAALEDIFHMLMVINPGIEIYLVDPEGRLMAYSAPPGKVKRERVSLAPISAFLEGQTALPVLGDDPRHPSRSKIFSAAPIMSQGRLQGYVYVVLGGELYDSVAQMVQASYILRLAAGAAAIGLLLTLAAGLLSFNWLTRRLRRLTAAVVAFKQSDFQRPMSLPAWRGRRGDEIDQLGLTIEQMSRRIMDQIRQVRGADASRRELIANISHDLRTPMTSLQGYLETLVIKGDELSGEERRHYLDLAVQHSQRLSRLIDELFELAMLETQAPPLNFEPFSLTELVQDVVQKFKLEAERKTLDLGVELPESAAFVSGDIGLIERVTGAGKPDRERDQVYPQGWVDRPGLERGAGADRDLDLRLRPGHRRGRPAPHLRALLPGGQAPLGRARRHRPGPGHRQADPAAARQSDPGGEPTGRRHPLQLSAPGGERQVGRRPIQ